MDRIDLGISKDDAMIILESLVEASLDGTIEKNKQERNEMEEARHICDVLKDKDNTNILYALERKITVSREYLFGNSKLERKETDEKLDELKSLGLIKNYFVDRCEQYELTEFGRALLEDPKLKEIIYK